MNNTHNCRILIPLRGRRGITDGYKFVVAPMQPSEDKCTIVDLKTSKHTQVSTESMFGLPMTSVGTNCAFGTSPTWTRTHAFISQVFFITSWKKFSLGLVDTGIESCDNSQFG